MNLKTQCDWNTAPWAVNNVPQMELAVNRPNVQQAMPTCLLEVESKTAAGAATISVMDAVTNSCSDVFIDVCFAFTMMQSLYNQMKINRV